MNRRTLIRLTVPLLAVATLGVACGGGGGGSTPSAPAQSASTPGGAVSTTPAPASGAVAGTWNGTYENTSPAGSGTFTINFTQTGSTLSGTISVQNTPCITEGTITGTLNGTTIAFGAVKGAVTIAYQGTLSGDTMSGTYSAGPDCGNAKGAWEATRG